MTYYYVDVCLYWIEVGLIITATLLGVGICWLLVDWYTSE